MPFQVGFVLSNVLDYWVYFVLTGYFEVILRLKLQWAMVNACVFLLEEQCQLIYQVREHIHKAGTRCMDRDLPPCLHEPWEAEACNGPTASYRWIHSKTILCHLKDNAIAKVLVLLRG